MKRWLAGAAVALTAFFSLSVGVQAQEMQYVTASATTITTTVPETHTVTLIVSGGGSVTVNNQTYKTESGEITIQLPRSEKIVWQFLPEEGYTIDKVFYNGTDVTDALVGGTYTAEPVFEDGMEVKVTFAKEEQASENKPDNDSGSSESDTGDTENNHTESEQQAEQTTNVNSPDTGDHSMVGLWSVFAIVSAVLSVFCLVMFKKRRRKA